MIMNLFLYIFMLRFLVYSFPKIFCFFILFLNGFFSNFFLLNIRRFFIVNLIPKVINYFSLLLFILIYLFFLLFLCFLTFYKFFDICLFLIALFLFRHFLLRHLLLFLYLFLLLNFVNLLVVLLL